MLERVYQAMLSKSLSKRNDSRFVIVNTETGEIVDDAQGYGYKSKPKAYKAYAYKLNHRKKRSQSNRQEENIHG